MLNRIVQEPGSWTIAGPHWQLVECSTLEFNPSGANSYQNSYPLPPGKKKRGDKTHLIRPRFESDRQLSQRANQSNECLPNPTATNKLRTTHRRRSGKKERPPKNKLEIFLFSIYFSSFFFFCFSVAATSSTHH